MSMTLLYRFPRYLAVGLLGISGKIAVLSVLVESVGLDYMKATAIAVEIAILHSFLWHFFWTWRDRSSGISVQATLLRMVRYHIANGAVGFMANLVLMRLLVGQLGLHYLPANMAATCAAGLANFLLSDFFVFVSDARDLRLRDVEEQSA